MSSLPPASASSLREREFSRILLIKPTALGDVVHTVPVLVKLRRRYPKAQIDWLVTPENAELVRHHPALNRVVLFDRRAYRQNRVRAFGQTLGLLRAIRGAWYDLAIDLHGQLRSAIFSWATGAPVRIGFDRPKPGAPRHGWAGAREGAWLAATHRLPIRTLQVHAIDRYLWLGDLLGFDDAPPEHTLYLAEEELALAQRLLAPLEGKPFVLLAPGTMWETKHWRIEGFAALALRLREGGWPVVLSGTAAEKRLTAAILQAAPDCLDLSGQTSPAGLAAVLREARLCVTNDSGAMHLAVASGTPVVPVFGPTDPVKVGPYGQLEHVVSAGVECSGCGLRRLSQCPNGHACMQLVIEEMVWSRMEPLLAGGPR